MLAQVIGGSGDQICLLSYGRRVQQQLLPGNLGPSASADDDHLLSQVERSCGGEPSAGGFSVEESARRRGLVIWITEIAESAGRPEVVSAVAETGAAASGGSVLLEHPELDALAAREPKNAEEMFASTAAQEMLEWRREDVAKLRQQGVLVVETTPAEVGASAISSILR